MNNHLINGVEVIIEEDSNIDYERYNFIWKLISFILNLLPFRVGGYLINKSGKKTRAIKERATTYFALDTLYNNYKFSFKDGFFGGLINYFWFKLGNPRAVRNRLKLVKKILNGKIFDLIKKQENGKINIFSLGCGSARAIIETIYDIKKNGINLDVLNIWLLDKDKEALNSSKILVSKYQLEKYNFSFILDKVRNFDDHQKNLDIIEMVGVVDYLSDENAIDIFKKIYNNLKGGGFFITANIKDNKEALFVTKAVNWRMIYREPEDLIRIILVAGFERYKIKIIFEPLKTHMIAICEK